MISSIRADLYYGAAYGLAVSAVIWSLVLFTPSPAVGGAVLVALAALAGAARGSLRPFGRWSLLYPCLLAALIVDGPGTSLLAALAGLASADAVRRIDTRRRWSRRAFDAGTLTLAAAVAAAVWLLIPDLATTLDPRLVPATAAVAHALTFAIALQSLRRTAMLVAGRRSLALGHAAEWLALVPGLACGILAGAGLALAWSRSLSQSLVLAATLLAVVLSVLHARRERRRLRERLAARTNEICRSMTGALATLVEARDAATRDHLQRVQRICMAVGRRLRLPARELEALSSASLLHDLGKVAVPDGILSKPGRLTTSEMETIKIHPDVGADILQCIPFPYPLAAIVRHHHERWDGAGYPAGLAGEAIPIGSRILTVVDSYDALTSHRPYRQALPHEEVIGFLRRESGTIFDAEAVEALIEHLELHPELIPEPDEETDRPMDDDATVLDESAAGNLPLSQRELQTLYEISRATGYEMNIDEYLTLVSCKLAALVPYRSLVVYFLEPSDELLRAGFAIGDAANKLRLMTIPLGERMSGWTALQQRAFIGQNHLTPLERDGARSDLEEWGDDPEIAPLRSTLVAPMVAGERCVGVITLYDGVERTFTADERRILVRVAGCVAQLAEQLDGHAEPSDASLTDPLTGVPNARFLWLETAHRVSRQGEGFGLLAFRVLGVERINERLGNEAADRVLGQIARRFAASAVENETLVRFGHDLFIVLTSNNRSGELVDRWHAIALDIEQPLALGHDGVVHQVRLTAAHAAYPADGSDLEALLETVDARLALAAKSGRTILPFRRKEVRGQTV